MREDAFNKVPDMRATWQHPKKHKRKREQTVSGEPQSSSLGRRDGGGGAHHS